MENLQSDCSNFYNTKRLTVDTKNASHMEGIF